MLQKISNPNTIDDSRFVASVSETADIKIIANGHLAW